jgi:hypothetical protein
MECILCYKWQAWAWGAAAVVVRCSLGTTVQSLACTRIQWEFYAAYSWARRSQSSPAAPSALTSWVGSTWPCRAIPPRRCRLCVGSWRDPGNLWVLSLKDVVNAGCGGPGPRLGYSQVMFVANEALALAEDGTSDDVCTNPQDAGRIFLSAKFEGWGLTICNPNGTVCAVAEARLCVCVFLASGYNWVTVKHEIPISSAQTMTSFHTLELSSTIPLVPLKRGLFHMRRFQRVRSI